MTTADHGRPFGRTGLILGPVGLGTWVFGGSWTSAWGPIDDDESRSTIRSVIGAGVNWIDTAPVYGFGHAEELVGDVMASLPSNDRPLLFTKCGFAWDPGRPQERAHLDLVPASIRRECEASLARLRTDQIDLYQVHAFDVAGPVPVEETWGEMARLQDEGKVRFLGISNAPTAVLDRCQSVRRVDSLQYPFSLIRRETATDALAWARERGAGFLAYSPVASGLLTDAMSTKRIAGLAEEDWRRAKPDFIEPRLSANLALRDALVPIARRTETSAQAVAIAWVLAWTAVSGAIAGARSRSQAAGWLQARDLRLEPADLEAIDAAIARSGGGSGPTFAEGSLDPPAITKRGDLAPDRRAARGSQRSSPEAKPVRARPLADA